MVGQSDSLESHFYDVDLTIETQRDKIFLINKKIFASAFSFAMALKQIHKTKQWTLCLK
jgi:hypothetical protein